MPNTRIQEEVQSDVIAQLPKEFKVMLHNDDTTTFQFVIELLEVVFHKDFEEAIMVTQLIHDTGIGIAGVYTREIAEEKTSEATKIARMNGFSLQVTFEEA